MESISYPLKYDIKIDFCQEKKKFYFSTPISLANHKSVQSYVQARKDRVFKPFATSFDIDDQELVRITQEIPFHGGGQTSLRHLTSQFWRLAKRCHKMLSEIAIEEKHREASS